MKILSKALGCVSALADVEPLIALFLGAALLGSFSPRSVSNRNRVRTLWFRPALEEA